MTKESFLPANELEPLAHSLAGTFIQRRDLFAQQLRDGSYICVRQALETAHLAAHLQGKLTLGAYVLDPASRARYIAFDADAEESFAQLFQMAGALQKQGVPAYLEQSRRGEHLWLFLPEPVPGKDARLFGQRLAAQYGLAGIELFPKQSCLSGGPGSLIRLPFGVHRKTGKRYSFYRPDGQPIARTLTEQLYLLSAPKIVPGGFFRQVTTQPSPTRPESPPVTASESKKPLSERIKESISVRDFVSQFVELDTAGRGLCPFHDDRHKSFSVNAEGNYWHCFAGCGGGSVIDFWMKWKRCDFKAAAHELATLLTEEKGEPIL